jgi:hypothetical protein
MYVKINCQSERKNAEDSAQSAQQPGREKETTIGSVVLFIGFGVCPENQKGRRQQEGQRPALRQEERHAKRGQEERSTKEEVHAAATHAVEALAENGEDEGRRQGRVQRRRGHRADERGPGHRQAAAVQLWPA